MRTPGPLLGAGNTFAAAVLGGFVLGLWLSRRTGLSWWPIAGLFAGVLAGGGVAFRLLLGVRR